MLILASGMPRSGSTWLYNAVRLMLEKSSIYPTPKNSGWIGDLRQLYPDSSCLIKIHDFEEDLVSKANLIVYSYRDVRDALASSVRMFQSAADIDKVNHWIQNDMNWKAHAHFVMKYEDFILSPRSELEKLAAVIGYSESIVELEHNLGSLNYNSQGEKNRRYHTLNLFHKEHITDGRHGSWSKNLPNSLVDEIEDTYSDWLRSNNYPLNR